MPQGKVKSSSKVDVEDQALFPQSIINEFLPAGPNCHGSFSKLVENYLTQMVSSLVSFKSQSVLIRKSIVALGATASSSSTVTCREVCRTLRNFSGVAIPDVPSVTRVPATIDTNLVQPAVLVTPSAASIGTAGGLGVGILPAKRKASQSLSNGPRIPKKRGRPSNKDKAPV